MMECTDTLRQFARANGFTERVVLTVERGFDWKSLSQHANALSLFASKRWLELHLSDKSPGNEGSNALLAYLQPSPPANTVLLITAGKLDATQQKAKWFSALEERGVVIQVWPIEISQLPEWIAQRLANYGLQTSPEAIQIIAERSEGHLLACTQEIEKLYLLYGAGRIDTSQVLQAVADSARFEIFDWVDTVLAGDTQRCIRQLQGLRTEGYEPILIAWALTKEIRNLCQITKALQSGQSQEQVFKTYRVWQQRRSVMTRAMKRHTPRVWAELLRQAASIDRLIKGVERGNVWDELSYLSLQVAGVNLGLH